MCSWQRSHSHTLPMHCTRTYCEECECTYLRLSSIEKLVYLSLFFPTCRYAIKTEREWTLHAERRLHAFVYYALFLLFEMTSSTKMFFQNLLSFSPFINVPVIFFFTSFQVSRILESSLHYSSPPCSYRVLNLMSASPQTLWRVTGDQIVHSV